MREFYPGCASREDELRLLQNLSENNRSLQAQSQQAVDQLGAAQGALDGALGRSGHTEAEQEFQATAPDPIADPDGFQRWSSGLVAHQEQRIDDLRTEQRDLEQRNQLWQEFRGEYPDLSKHPTLVQAAFLEETGDGVLPDSPEAAESLKSRLADRIRGYGVGGGEEEGQEQQASAPGMVLPETIDFDQADADRTAGIPGGTHNASPSHAPANHSDQETADLVGSLKALRAAPEMAGYF